MSKKNQQICHALVYAKQLAGNSMQEWSHNLKSCEDKFQKAEKFLKNSGWVREREETMKLAHTSFTIIDWLRYKQCYTISQELASDLFSMDDLSFPIDALRLPFRTVFLDYEEIFQEQSDGAIPLGAFVTVGDVPYGDASASLCSVVTLFIQEGQYIFGGLSFDCNPEHMEMTLEDTVKVLAKDYPREKSLIIKALKFAAYLSCEKPDILEDETQKVIYKPSEKPKFSSVRKWNVGVRYAIEYQKQKSEKSAGASIKGRRSPRPHMRKAHWQVYRTGSGRKGKKVLWIQPVMVGVEITKFLPVVIREKK